MYQVDSEDANFLFLENTDSPTHISLVYLYDQPDDDENCVAFTDIVAHIDSRLNSAPVFRQKIQRTPADIDYPYWVDDDQFDLEFHVRHLALPKPGNWRQLCIQVARLHSRPLDMNKPLWELYVVEGLNDIEGFSRGSFALYFKVHHCAMDEFTALELLESLHESSPVHRRHTHSLQHITYLPASAPSLPQMVSRGLVNNSFKTLRLCYQSLVHFRTFSGIMTRMSIRVAHKMLHGETLSGNPETRFGGPLTPSRIFEGGFYSRKILDDYISKIPGATLTHAIAAICGEAMRLYLDAHDELTGNSLNALLEVNVRNAGAHALAGNRIAIRQILLNTDIEYPVGRLQAIVATNSALYSQEEAELTSFKLRSLYENLPAPLLARMGKRANRHSSFNHQLMQGGNCGIAELRGSKAPLYLLGAKLAGFSSITPLYSGCGLMFTASTYHDRVGITFTSDRSMMPDSKFMRECLDEAVNAVAQSTEVGPDDVYQDVSSESSFSSEKLVK